MSGTPESPDLGRAIRAGFLAYVIWGLLTIYWKQLKDFSAFELIGWRIVTASVVMAVVVTAGRRWGAIRAAFANRSAAAWIVVESLLLTTNWTAFVYAVVHGRVLESALGYFMAPLGTMALGIFVLGERPSPAQKAAMALAGVAVVELTVSYGRVPFAALIMAASWSFYGLFKRRIPLPAVESFAAESFVLAAPAAVMIAVLAGGADSVPRGASATELVFVALAGVATAVPLILFAFAATRVPLTILGPLNYLVPLIMFTLGWLLYDEPLPVSRVVGFTLVWAALGIVTYDRLRHSFAGRAGRLGAVSAD